MNDEQKRRRILAVVALLASGGVLAYLAFGGIGENLVYYWSPSELRAAGDRAFGANIRLGGLVAPGSIELASDGLTLRFTVTDGTESVAVAASAVPPAMFREGIGVLLEGTLLRNGEFESHRLMVKHDNEYRAPGEGEAPDMETLIKSMQFERGDA